jgi:hypothetical protein
MFLKGVKELRGAIHSEQPHAISGNTGQLRGRRIAPPNQ